MHAYFFHPQEPNQLGRMTERFLPCLSGICPSQVFLTSLFFYSWLQAAERAGSGCFTCASGSSGPNSSSSGHNGPHGHGGNASNHAANSNGRKREAIGHLGPAGSLIPPKLSSAAAAYANSQTGGNAPTSGGTASHMKPLPPHATSPYYSLQQQQQHHHHHHHINTNFMAGVGAHGQNLNGNTGSYYGWVMGPNGHPGGGHPHHHPHHSHPINHHHPIVNGAQKWL